MLQALTTVVLMSSTLGMVPEADYPQTGHHLWPTSHQGFQLTVSLLTMYRFNKTFESRNVLFVIALRLSPETLEVVNLQNRLSPAIQTKQ